jgi:hypothetical protein
LSISTISGGGVLFVDEDDDAAAPPLDPYELERMFIIEKRKRIYKNDQIIS